MVKGGRKKIVIMIVGVVIFIFFALLLPPFALALIGSVDVLDWHLLSDVGQAYGFSSAALSALALIAIAISIYAQVKQGQLAQAQTFRTLQTEISKLAAEHPEVYFPCYGAETAEEILAAQRVLFVSLRTKYWLAGYELGEFDDLDIRGECAPELIGNEISRAWWASVRLSWTRKGLPSRRRQFGEIVDRAFRDNVEDFRQAHSISEDDTSVRSVEDYSNGDAAIRNFIRRYSFEEFHKVSAASNSGVNNRPH